MDDTILSLDLGTTGVRARVYAADGAVLGAAYARLAMHFPAPDRVEQDADDFIERSRAVIAAVLKEAGCVRPRAIGVVSQRGSVVAWDAVDGRPLAPVIGWQDRRTLARVSELRALGLPLNTLASCTKFEWLVREVSAVRSAAHRGRLRLGTPDAWLTWKLTGGEAFVTDPSNAGATGLYDPGACGWFDAALELFDQEASWHAEVVATNAVVGQIETGMPAAGAPLAARAGDQQAACYAQGVAVPGDAKITFGTSAMLDRCTGPAPSQAPEGAYDLPLWRLARADGTAVDAFCHEGTVITAGAAVDWLQRIGVLNDPNELDALAAEGHPGVTFVPALAGLGTPHMADRVRGRFDGLGLDTGRAELVRAVLDGIAQRSADLAASLGVDGVLRADGGLSRSGWLLQRLADLSGCEVWQASETETTARGGAGLAASAPDVAGPPLPAPAPAWRIVPALDAAERQSAREAWRARVEGLVADS